MAFAVFAPLMVVLQAHDIWPSTGTPTAPRRHDGPVAPWKHENGRGDVRSARRDSLEHLRRGPSVVAVVTPLLVVSNAETVTHAADATVPRVATSRVAEQKRLKRDKFGIIAVRLVDSLQHLRAEWHAGFPYAVRAVVRDPTNFRQLWALAVRGERPVPPVPRIDFAHDMVIVAATGAQASTGFRLIIDSVTARDEVIEIYIQLAAGWCVQVAGIRNSVDMVKVPRASGVVVFHERYDCTTIGPAVHESGDHQPG